MPRITYRFFLLDADSHISSAAVIVCADDAAAKLQAREILAKRPDCHAIEVWELDRRVQTLSNVAL
jgi:hypothetical protein